MRIECFDENSILEVSPLLQKGEKRKKHYHIETFFFLFYIGTVLFGTVSTNALEVYYCRYFWDVSEQACLNTSSPYFEDTQRFAAAAQLITNSLSYIIPAMLFLFIGPWSDIHGRKLLMILPTFGFLISFCLWTWGSTVPRINPLYFVIFTMPYTIPGGALVIIFAGYCSMCDLTPEKDRTYSLSMLQTSIYTAGVVGSIGSVFLIPYGYTVIFSTSSFFLLLASFNLCLFVKETVPPHTDPSKESMKANKNIFQIEYLYAVARCYRKQTPKNRRTIVLVTIGRLLFYFTVVGDAMINYLFLQLRMNISLSEYAVYTTFTMIILAVGTAGGSWILIKKLQMNDVFMLMIITGLQMLYASFYIFSNHMWLIYIGSSFSCLGSLFLALFKSFLSKIIDSEDFGKVLAATDIGESLIGFVASLIYPILYQLTLLTFPAAVYVLSLLAYTALLIILIIVVKINEVPWTNR